MEPQLEVWMRNNQPRVLGLCTGHRLMPGRDPQVCKMSEYQWSVLLKDKIFRHWQKLNWLSVVTKPKEEKKPVVKYVSPSDDSAPDESHPQAQELAQVNAKDAKKLVEKCDDLKLLEVWYAVETRGSVLKAIEAQVDKLEEGEGSEGEGADDEDIESMLGGEDG